MLSVATAKWPGGRCSAFFQLTQDVKCCHSHLTMSQLLYACGKGAEKEGFGLGFFSLFVGGGDIYLGYIFWIIFKPLGIPGLEECGLATPNFRPFGTGRRKTEEKINWMKKTWGGRRRYIFRSSKDLVTEKKSIYAHNIRHQISCGGRRKGDLFIFRVRTALLTRIIPLMKY